MTQDPNRLKPRAPLSFVQGQEQQQPPVQQNSQTVPPQYNNTVMQQQSPVQQEPEAEQVEEEKATEKMTIYITKTQARKIRKLIRDFEEATDQRTDQNKLMRKFIDKLDLSMII